MQASFSPQTIIEAVAKISIGRQEQLHTFNLSSPVKFNGDYAINLRDFTRLAFAELGIDVEFSGRNENEKGVIIDIDEERVAELGLNLDALRFGQTVVRVNVSRAEPTEIRLLISEAEPNGQTMYPPQMLISQWVMAGLKQVKAGNSHTV